jgi:hypothetical protein
VAWSLGEMIVRVDKVDLDVLRGAFVFGESFAWECDGTRMERKRLRNGLERWGTIRAK